MSKVRFSYKEFIENCKDPDNGGKATLINIVSVNGDSCTYQFVNDDDNAAHSGDIEHLVNGAMRDLGVITNPEILKDWDGWSSVDSF